MNDSHYERFSKALLGAAEVAGKKLSAQAIALYWQTLKRYELADVENAIGHHLSDPDVGQFMPKPADIIRNIDGNTETRAMQAWTRVVRSIGSVGSYQTVVFDDWRIHAVIADMGGWIAFGKFETEEMPFRAREFEKRYRGYRQFTPKYPKKLIGRSEASNAEKNQHIDPPVLIGEPEKAQKVFAKGSDQQGALTVGDVLPQLTRPKAQVPA